MSSEEDRLAATKSKKSAPKAAASGSAGRPKIASSHSAGPKGSRAEAPGKKPAKKVAKAVTEKPFRPKKKAPPPKVGKRAARGMASSDDHIDSSEGHGPRSARSIASDATAQLALAVAGAALEKKAVNVQIVDVVGRVDYADYLVVMSGRSDRHVLSVADSIEDALRKLTPPRKPIAVEGRPQGNWVVLDFGDVVAHVFQEDARSFYDLDSLWKDARRVPVPLDVARV
jgi:ribosome-associated protein